MNNSIFQTSDNEEAALELIDGLMQQANAPAGEGEATMDQAAAAINATDMPGQEEVPVGILEAAGESIQQDAGPEAVPIVESGQPKSMVEALQAVSNASMVGQMSTNEQRPAEPDVYSPEANTLPPKLPPGTTSIHPDDYPFAVQALAASFGSMNQVGMLIDPADRTGYAISVMNNRELRADIKAQLIDQAMRDGRIVPEALGKDWYAARNLNLRMFNENGGRV